MRILYVIRDLMQTHAKYVPFQHDRDFFHHALNVAKDAYRIKGGIPIDDKDAIDSFKRTGSPVLSVSTVLKRRDGDDDYIERKEVNARARTKYLMIDADFNAGQEDEAQAFRERCIALADTHQTPLVIYPTLSYPTKPRFRVAFFVKNQLNEDTYYKAMMWLYEQLGTQPTDPNDANIYTTNNAPVFINDAQIEGIYDTTQDEALKPLDNKLFKGMKGKPKVKRADFSKKDARDKMKVDIECVIEGVKVRARKGYLDTYDDFWKFCTSIARAEFFKQITEEEAERILDACTVGTNDEVLRQTWLADNMRVYSVQRNRIFESKDDLSKTRPLVSYNEIKQAILDGLRKELEK